MAHAKFTPLMQVRTLLALHAAAAPAASDGCPAAAAAYVGAALRRREFEDATAVAAALRVRGADAVALVAGLCSIGAFARATE